MKKILGIALLSILLQGCFETYKDPQVMSSSNTPSEYVVEYAHVDDPETKYSSSSRISEIVASRDSSQKCKSVNSSNTRGCLRYRTKVYYPDGKVNDFVNWYRALAVYNENKDLFVEPKITEKPKKNPKKKKPKATPNDDKIVPAGSGSGFFVSSNGTVITNHHVIEGCKINKVSHKGSQYEAKVLAVDKVNDIAILKTNITPDRVFPVSNEDVSLLEDVVVAGYPLGKQVSSAIKTHKGVVTALAGAGDNYSNFQTDASINQGNSGGPILDQKGNVVGIAVATWVEEGVQGVHFGIKSSTLKTFASANGLKFLPANNRDLSNKDLGKLIMQSTVYVECHMTIASIKKMIAEAENKKAFFKEYQ